ncbi:MAG: hypothetical protein RI967_2194 [Planctomycetota bacterium]
MPSNRSSEHLRAAELVDALPAHLAERVSLVGAPAEAPRGEFVLYWTHHALRTDANPSLDAARAIGDALGIPVLVYAGISGVRAHQSDRHLTFLLEGYRDLASQLAAIGVPFACSLRKDGRLDVALDRLAARAAVVVTDDMPREPWPDRLASLARRTGRAVLAVDSACVVPMNLVGTAFGRAFAFRDATRAEREARVARPWPVAPRDASRFPLVDHGLPEVDWDRLDIAALVASLAVDHSVGPVPDTRGGSAAGLARWRAFVSEGLANYARDRNDATIHGGVSRLSPYLHYGMVSPLRIAREAAEAGGEGAEKFLDELLVWRELAYAWCRHVPGHASFAALPGWARATLAARQGDSRTVLPRERLARGRTGEALWDLAQRSLVAHGELHNNLRMTWGKAIPAWCATPEEAIALLFELNDRFALDGCDPASVCGLLWCLGLFDRAHAPETPILGSVRARPVAEHARRVDLDAYGAIVARPTRPLRVAVIGAGVAGLACARTLADHGIEVEVFEKARGPGGRTSTRRGEHGSFDHGAQYFTVRDARFARAVRGFEEEGVAARWNARFARIGAEGVEPFDPSPRFVGIPSMSAVCGHLAEDLRISYRSRVASIAREGARWRVVVEEETADDPGTFDAVLSTAPAPQTALLLGAAAPAIAATASQIAMRATWSLMLAFEGRVALPFDHGEVLVGAREVGEALGWVSRQSSKPGRADDGVDRWTVLARPEWSEERLERAPEAMIPEIEARFRALAASLGVAVPRTVHASAHRWRFALAGREVGPEAVYDARLGIGAAGDWLRGSRIEDAYLSGIALAGRVLGTLDRRLDALRGAAPQAVVAGVEIGAGRA